MCDYDYELIRATGIKVCKIKDGGVYACHLGNPGQWPSCPQGQKCWSTKSGHLYYTEKAPAQCGEC